MGSELIVVENMTTALAPRIETLIRPMGLQVDQMRTSFLMACEKVPKLLQCTALSLQNSYLTGAVLGLMMDGVTGQGFVLPYNVKNPSSGRKEQTAQFQIGYKGVPVLGYRAGFTINMGVIRDGDEYDINAGSSPYIKIKPKLGNEHKRNIIASWATASKPGFAPTIAFMSIDEIEAIRSKSKANDSEGGFSPWNDPRVGFPVMAAKSSARRLLRTLPVIQAHMALALDTAQEERGMAAFLDERGGLVTGEGIFPSSGEPIKTIDMRAVEFRIVRSDGSSEVFPTVQQWASRVLAHLPKMNGDQVLRFREANAALMSEYHRDGSDEAMSVSIALTNRAKELGV